MIYVQTLRRSYHALASKAVGRKHQITSAPNDGQTGATAFERKPLKIRGGILIIRLLFVDPIVWTAAAQTPAANLPLPPAGKKARGRQRMDLPAVSEVVCRSRRPFPIELQYSCRVRCSAARTRCLRLTFRLQYPSCRQHRNLPG
jgi:hypothetical protein